jgi:hypothetical protein
VVLEEQVSEKDTKKIVILRDMIRNISAERYRGYEAYFVAPGQNSVPGVYFQTAFNKEVVVVFGDDQMAQKFYIKLTTGEGPENFARCAVYMCDLPTQNENPNPPDVYRYTVKKAT